jgi:hypothetical protein
MKSEEIIWLICIGIIIILGIIINIYKDRFTKWLLMVLWLIYIPGVIYSTYLFFTLDIHNFKLYWGAMIIIIIYKMYRNRYMIMKEKNI